MVQTLDQAGPVWFAPSKDIVFNGGGLDPNDVVQFLSPIQGIIYMSETAVATALKLEARALPQLVVGDTGWHFASNRRRTFVSARVSRSCSSV
jgi:hypothetical protein